MPLSEPLTLDQLRSIESLDVLAWNRPPLPAESRVFAAWQSERLDRAAELALDAWGGEILGHFVAVTGSEAQAWEAFGTFSEGTGLAADATAIGCPIIAGDTWYFQAWYRDPFGPCGNGSNFSNAMEVTFY